MPQQPRPDGPPASSTQPAAGTPEYSTPAGDGETTARVLGPAERLATLAHVFTPPLLSGVIDRRPWATALVERLEWDAAGVRTARRLHLRYGPGPLRLWRRGRPSVLALDPRDARRLLDETPDPFTPAAAEKRAALGVFQPHGVLISGWDQRAALRRANETILATARVTHPDAERFTRVISEETSALVGSGDRGRVLDWPLFEDSWWTTVRRLVLGERARDDTVLIEQLKRLRGAGNWGPLGPRRRALRAAFLRRLELHARHAEADCLAARTAELDAVGQIPHWLFAYDAAGMTAMRALTLLAIHPEDATAARAEVAALALVRPCGSLVPRFRETHRSHASQASRGRLRRLAGARFDRRARPVPMPPASSVSGQRLEEVTDVRSGQCLRDVRLCDYADKAVVVDHGVAGVGTIRRVIRKAEAPQVGQLLRFRHNTLDPEDLEDVLFVEFVNEDDQGRGEAARV